MNHPAGRVQPQVQVGSSGLFAVARAVGLFFGIVSTMIWGGSAAVNDSSGMAGSLVFLLLSGSLFVFAAVAGRNVRLFATEELVGSVGPLGGVRVCARGELAEVRTVWHWYQGRGTGSWVFPTLHFRQRGGTDAFVTPVLLYRSEGLNALGKYLGMPINLDRPTAAKAS